MPVDVNMDVAEGSSDGPGASSEGELLELLAAVTSVNIACGFHGGNPSLMRMAVRAAHQQGVAVGAHPSYPDARGFGRVPMALPLETVVDDVLYQVGALSAIARTQGVRLRHVRAHGALYNSLSTDPVLALAVAAALRELDPDLLLVLQAGSPSSDALAASGHPALAEGFADRAYLRGGTLAPQRRAGAVITNVDDVAGRAVALAKGEPVPTLDGASAALEVATLHVNSNPPHTLEAALAVKGALAAAGVKVQAPNGP